MRKVIAAELLAATRIDAIVCTSPFIVSAAQRGTLNPKPYLQKGAPLKYPQAL